MAYTVTLIEGDGIGPEVTGATCRILEAAGAPIVWERMPAGAAAFEAVGNPMPDETLDSIRRNRVGLKGPLGTPKGAGYRSANVTLRQKLQLYTGWRPVLSLPGVKSRYTDVDPRRWEFRPGPEGKPRIAGPAGVPPLRFNLSHTRGLVACVVTLGLDSGVDVERPGRQIRDPLALARHGFAPAERRALRRLSGRAQRELFCDLWTLKEAYVKARGAGFLALPARKLAYEIAPGGIIRLTIEPELEDRPEAWQVALLAPTADHRLAVAIRRGRRPDLTLVTHEVEPPLPSARRVRPEVLASSPSPETTATAGRQRTSRTGH